MAQAVAKEFREAKADLERGYARIFKVFGGLERDHTMIGFNSMLHLRNMAGELENLSQGLEAYHHAGQIVELEHKAPKASGNEMTKKLDYHRAKLSLAKEMHGVTVFRGKKDCIETVHDGGEFRLRFTDANKDDDGGKFRLRFTDANKD